MSTRALIVAILFNVSLLALAAHGRSSSVRDVPRLSRSSRDMRQQCAPAWVEGIDVYDGQGKVDWAAARDAGVSFAFVKATQGTYGTQSTFAGNWAGAKAAGVLRGAYHFFDPTEDGTAQAAHFLAVVGAQAADDLPVMLDLECPDGDPDCVYGGRSGRADPVSIRDRVDAFLEAVARGTGSLPLVYTFPAYFGTSGVDPSGLQAFPLFVARVGTAGKAASGSCLGVPAPWTEAVFWQYAWTGAVTGVHGAVDHDRFLGDAASLSRVTRHASVAQIALAQRGDPLAFDDTGRRAPLDPLFSPWWSPSAAR